jgi:cold shock CspA family protein
MQPIHEAVLGEVVWVKKTFGFIRPTKPKLNMKKDVFFHFDDVSRDSDFACPLPSDLVKFDIVKDEKGLHEYRAANVCLVARRKEVLSSAYDFYDENARSRFDEND